MPDAVSVSPQPAEGTAASDSVDIRLRKADDRPWEEKWLLILHNRDRLEGIYNGQIPGASSLDSESAANYVLIECHNLKDWLKWTLPGGITARAVESHFLSSRPLCEAAAVSNTHKHHTRSNNAMEARIRIFKTDFGGTKRHIEYEMNWADPNTQYTKDALVLADECVSEWRRFFQANNISEP
jgi:hypothetical protein